MSDPTRAEAVKAADDLVAAALIYEDEALLQDAETVQRALAAPPSTEEGGGLREMKVPRYDYTVSELLDEAVRRVVGGELEAPGGSVGTLGDLTAHGLILSMRDVIQALARDGGKTA